MNRKKPALFAAGTCLTAALSTAHAASFNCARVSTPDEVTVCVNTKLSADDEALNQGFIRARQLDRNLTIAVGRAFIQKRRSCGSNVACISAAQSAAGAEYAAIIRAHETSTRNAEAASVQGTSTGGGLSQRVEHNFHVRVVNNSSRAIIGLFASPTMNNKWHSNMIPNGQFLASGKWIDANFDDGSGQCVFDLKTVDVDGNAAVRQAENVCAMSSWTIHD